MNPLIIQDLENRLMKLPNEIYQQEKKMLEAKETLEMLKISHEVRFSMALLEAKRPNATEKKADAIKKTEVEKKLVMQALIALERQNAILTAKNNEFIALRKVASMEERMQGQSSGN